MRDDVDREGRSSPARARALTPVVLPSFAEHLTTFGERHGIKTDFSADGIPEHLPAELETVVYHIAQEALTNVVRHAHAHHVQVALGMEAGMLRVEIHDDGIGLPAGGVQAGTGLTSIREQARALGGRVMLGSGPGARLRVLLPCGTNGRAEHGRRRAAAAAAGRRPRLRLVHGPAGLSQAHLSS